MQSTVSSNDMQLYSGNASASPPTPFVLPCSAPSAYSYQPTGQPVLPMGQCFNYSNPSENAIAGTRDANSLLISSFSATSITAATTSNKDGPHSMSNQNLFAQQRNQDGGRDAMSDASSLNMNRRNAVANIRDGVDAGDWMKLYNI